MQSLSKSPAFPYGLAILLVAIAYVLRAVLADTLTGTSGLLFAPAILVSALAGGLLPGLFATLLALLPSYIFPSRPISLPNPACWL